MNADQPLLCGGIDRDTHYRDGLRNKRATKKDGSRDRAPHIEIVSQPDRDGSVFLSPLLARVRGRK
jgi:hypothetical protein